MLDLDKLSYRAYGNLLIVILLGASALMNLFPVSFKGLVLCTIQIPWYLFVRGFFSEPIHAYGLNKCCVATIIFFILLFICIKAMLLMLDIRVAVIITFSLTALCCYATSTLPNKQEDKGKLFFGYKRHDESKYEKLIEFIKYNGLDEKLRDAESRLAELDTQMYLIYKRKFREDKTFTEMVEEFDIDNPRIVEILDKVYFYMIGALKI
jgi:hypothetical protein